MAAGEYVGNGGQNFRWVFVDEDPYHGYEHEVQVPATGLWQHYPIVRANLVLARDALQDLRNSTEASWVLISSRARVSVDGTLAQTLPVGSERWEDVPNPDIQLWVVAYRKGLEHGV